MRKDILPATRRDYRFPYYSTCDSFNFVADKWVDVKSVPLEVHRCESVFWNAVRLQQPRVVVFGVDQSLLASGIIGRLASVENRPTIVSLIKHPDEALLVNCYEQDSDRVLAVPDCSARIFQALLDSLVRTEQSYPPYRLCSAIQTINFGQSEVRLHKKTFDVAQYLFINHGKLISKSRILQDLWGLDSQQCLTRRIEVHVSHVRRLLALDGSHGWEIRARKRKGYGIFRKAEVF